MILPAAAAALALSAAEPAAAPVSDRDIDLAEGYRVYQLPSAETLAADGYTGIRVFFKDAWGRHQPAVAVLRKGELAPQITAWTKWQLRGIRTMTGGLDGWDWRVVRLMMDEVRASPPEQSEQGFEWPHPPAPPPPPGEEEEASEYICMDSTHVAIEVIENGQVIRRERDSCPQDMTYSAVAGLPVLAADTLDGCGTLELQSPNWAVTRLNNCSILAGEERRSAAQLINELYRGGFSLSGNESRIADVLTPDSRLTLPDGAVLVGADAITDWYVAESRRRPEFGLEATTVTVDDAVGRLQGGLFYEEAADREHFLWAPMEQTWRRDGEGTWRLIDWTLQPYRKEVWLD